MLFDEIDLLEETTPEPAAFNMALDEALLAAVARSGRPLLRVYGWARAAVSFGYFERWEPVVAAFPGRDAVRRWTGGGVVAHGEDWTYSLLVPRGHPFARERAGESYRLLHGVLASALAACPSAAMTRGIAFAPEEEEGAQARSRACFENPVRHDLLENGRKIAGAAQRRSRLGLLHQGSVQAGALSCGFAGQLASMLAGGVAPYRLAPEVRREAARLAVEKYGTEAWNRRF